MLSQVIEGLLVCFGFGHLLWIATNQHVKQLALCLLGVSAKYMRIAVHHAACEKIKSLQLAWLQIAAGVSHCQARNIANVPSLGNFSGLLKHLGHVTVCFGVVSQPIGRELV